MRGVALAATLPLHPMTSSTRSSHLAPRAIRRAPARWVLSVALLALVSGLAVAPNAHAQRGRRRPAEPVVVPGDAARVAAQGAFAAGQFAEAERLYDQAYTESGNPIMLVGLADARERQGNAAGAVAALEEYLSLRSEAPDRSAVEARIAALRAQRGVVLVTAEPPGEVWLDGERTGYVTPVELTLPPGTHAIAVTLRGELVGEHAVEVPYGGRTTLALLEGALAPADGAPVPPGVEVPATDHQPGTDVPADATAPVDPREPTDAAPASDPGVSLEGDGVPLEEPSAEDTAEPASNYQPRRAAAITAGVAAGTLVVGTVLGFMALTEQSDFDDHPTASAADRGERLALFSDVMFGVAGIAAVTSIVLYVTDRRAQRDADADAEATRLRLTPLAGRRGAGLGATLQF